MNKSEVEEIKLKVSQAQEKIEEIKKARTEYQNALKQLDINEAGWMGFIEALSPYLSDSNSED